MSFRIKWRISDTIMVKYHVGRSGWADRKSLLFQGVSEMPSYVNQLFPGPGHLVSSAAFWLLSSLSQQQKSKRSPFILKTAVQLPFDHRDPYINLVRRHSAWGYRSPHQMEADHLKHLASLTVRAR
ncbi:hypothetical protein [Hymenobacter defluvii]|uniref:hypothetical protein n=1 Tax=Hymenobacter defluvii TaxID=2054411 RepID=UPI001AAE5787|nr:hypothetical protein [Hymenobacter defluvii]